MSIIKAFNQQIIIEALANVPELSSNTTVRDQLFELLMLQFDALSQHKKAISRIIRGTIGKDEHTCQKDIHHSSRLPHPNLHADRILRL